MKAIFFLTTFHNMDTGVIRVFELFPAAQSDDGDPQQKQICQYSL